VTRPPPWRAVSWRGEPGTVGPFTILPPTKYRDRYGVGGTLRHVADGPPTVDILDVTVTDLETGAAVTFPKVGPASAAALPVDLAPVDVAQLWRVGRILAARARAEVGRPSEAADRVEAIIAAVREVGPSATRLRVAEGRSIQEANVAIATAPAVPTVDAIRDALTAQWEADYDPSSGPDTPEAVLSAVIAKIATPFVDSAARTIECGGEVWEPLREGVGPLAIWDDLRPSQATGLMQLVYGARDRALPRCQAIIIEELTAAGVEFAGGIGAAS